MLGLYNFLGQPKLEHIPLSLLGGAMVVPIIDVTFSLIQGGRRQRNIGGALFSDYDVMISMTSLLLQYLAKILVGL